MAGERGSHAARAMKRSTPCSDTQIPRDPRQRTVLKHGHIQLSAVLGGPLLSSNCTHCFYPALQLKLEWSRALKIRSATTLAKQQHVALNTTAAAAAIDKQKDYRYYHYHYHHYHHYYCHRPLTPPSTTRSRPHTATRASQSLDCLPSSLSLPTPRIASHPATTRTHPPSLTHTGPGATHEPSALARLALCHTATRTPNRVSSLAFPLPTR
ncbi:hypothetical protein Q7P35_005899 [Cladosporium inversicolor]